MADKALNLNLGDFEKRGLYIIFKDGSRLDLSDERVERVTQEYWKNPAKIPPEVKKATEFQRCSFCPKEVEGGICNSIRPILPFLEVVDKYVSYDEVIAIYKGHRKEIYRISDTKMQDALVHLSILSMMHHCQTMVPYRKYFYGVIPLMSAKEASARIYLNIFWEHKGDKDLIDKFIFEFKEKMRIAAQNHMKRISLIYQSDAFLNALVKAQLITEFLTLDYDKILEDAFRQIELEK